MSLGTGSLGTGKICRAVKQKFVYGEALEYVPRGSDGGAYHEYQFRVCKPQESKRESSATQTTVMYTLALTERIVSATNTSDSFVIKGNKVILTDDGVGNYDVYTDCRPYRFGTIVEPSLGLWEPRVQPNFTFCGKDGTVSTLDDIFHSLSCRNALCVGLLAVPDKEYPVLHAEWSGGEPYISKGKQMTREAGEPKLTKDGEPLYYRKREIVNRYNYLQHKEHGNVSAAGALSSLPIAAYSNSPFRYQYTDGTDFGFGAPMFFHRGHISALWQTTTDINDAMRKYDYFVCPKQADNEIFPIGTVVEIERETAAVNYLPEKEGNGGVSTVIPYYEVNPPYNEVWTELDGQALTYGVFYDVDGDKIKEADSSHKPSKDGIKRTVCRGFWEKEGSIPIVSPSYVANTPARYPCRGLFVVEGDDGVWYPQLCVVNCQNGFGVPVLQYNVLDTKITMPHYYTIKRKWVQNAFGTDGRWELVIDPTFPYKTVGELPDWNGGKWSYQGKTFSR